jgi:hypothetical protein
LKAGASSPIRGIRFATISSMEASSLCIGA